MQYEKAGSVAASFALCDTFDDESADACMIALGAYAYNTLGGEAASVIAFCADAGNMFVDRCLWGAVRDDINAGDHISDMLCREAQNPASCDAYKKARQQEVTPLPPSQWNIVFTDCTTTKSPKKCFQALAKRVTQDEAVGDMLHALIGAEESPSLASSCHEFVHYLGQEAYRAHTSVPKALGAGTHVCYGGFYHGVLEGFFADKKVSVADAHELVPLIATACGQKQDYSEPIFYTECVHGVGHGILFLSDMDLPGALALCDTSFTGEARELCWGGVFMENAASTTNRDHPTRFISAGDPLYPCNSMEVRYRKICYQYQSTYFTKLSKTASGIDWGHVIALCQAVPVQYRAGSGGR